MSKFSRILMTIDPFEKLKRIVRKKPWVRALNPAPSIFDGVTPFMTIL